MTYGSLKCGYVTENWTSGLFQVENLKNLNVNN